MHSMNSHGPANSEIWSDCSNAQADLSLRWAHMVFAGFVVLRLSIKILQIHVPHKVQNQPSHSRIYFAVRMKKPLVLDYPQSVSKDSH